MSSSTATTGSMGISADTSFHVLEIQTKSTQVTFYLDGALVQTLTTNIPTALLRLNCIVSAKTSSQRSAQLDFWSTLSDRSASQGVNSTCLLL